MNRLQKINRLEMLKKQQVIVNSILAVSNDGVNKISSVPVALGNESINNDTSKIITLKIFDEIENQRDNINNAINNGIVEISRISTEQVINDTIETVGENVSKYMSFSDEIAKSYIYGSKPTLKIPKSEIVKMGLFRENATRQYDTLQSEIEAIMNSSKTIEGYRRLLQINQLYGNYLGGSISFPLNIYKKALISKGIDVSNINPSFPDSKMLSDRIWTNKDKEIIINTVSQSLRNRESSYELAKRLKDRLTSSVTRGEIDRVANTELVKAYSYTKKQLYTMIENEFTDWRVYVVIKTSPYHPRPDICDVLAGKYTLASAPLVPIHPHCICSSFEILESSDKNIRTSDVNSLIQKRVGFIIDNGVSIPSEIDGIPVTLPDKFLSKIASNLTTINGVDIVNNGYYYSVDINGILDNGNVLNISTARGSKKDAQELVKLLK